MRDSVGEVLASVCSSLSFSSKPDIAEALTLRRVMILCEEMGITQLHFEGDCLTVIRAVGGLSVHSKDVERIVFDI